MTSFAAPPRGPEEVLLVVEIAHSSLRYDRSVKIPLYARHHIPEVWIVDLVSNCVEVYRSPSGEGYADVSRIAPDGVLQPLMLPGGGDPGAGSAGVKSCINRWQL